jgi:peptide/nickel transport system permease protein
MFFNPVICNTQSTPAARTWESYMTSNLLAPLFALLIIWATTALIRHSFWGPRLKAAFRTAGARLGLALAGIFFTIAFLDSIAWIDGNGGQSDSRYSVELNSPRSLLDRLFSAAVGVPEYQFRERAASAPLAPSEFRESSFIDPASGEQLRRKKELRYTHLFGTDSGGRDTFFMVLKGVRPAVLIGTLPLLITLPIALIFGICAGYFGGRFDDFVVWVYTTLSSIPSLLLLISMVYAMGKDMRAVCIALGVTSWVGLCRLLRGESMKLRELEYIQAARCLGVPTRKIILRHILPNLTHIILITCILSFTSLVLAESILAYLGIGLPGSWGSTIASAKSEVAQDPVIWWNLLFASSALFLLVLSVNIVGDAIRDALDPRSSSE